MRASSPALAALGLAFMAFAASAQQDLEPAVQTSPVVTSPLASPSTPPAAVNAAPGTINSTARPKDAAAAKPTAAGSKPATAAAAPAGGPAAASGAAAPKGGKSSDRIELDTTQISGNRELPKVMYVVPWRKADPGDFSGRPLNSLLDEALTPVDRDVFRRQNRYYAALSGEPGSDKSQPGAAGEGSAAPTPKDEK
jgi:hypothetical protein